MLRKCKILLSPLNCTSPFLTKGCSVQSSKQNDANNKGHFLLHFSRYTHTMYLCVYVLAYNYTPFYTNRQINNIFNKIYGSN